MRLSRRSTLAWLTLTGAAIIVGCRFWLAADLPLTDSTEARYGEMGRKMVETGDWLMPQADYGVPYMAKPPLAIWLSAVGIELVGAGELGPRLLILLTAIAFLIYFYHWVGREIGPGAAATGVLALMSSTLFFVAMAAAMTDLVLVACVSVALLAFWRRLHGGDRSQEWLFFGMIGLGLLTKGPLAAFLVVAPILAWALATGRMVETWRGVHWVKGTLFASLVAVPWYAAAEGQHPGFLRYFLIGENLERFLVADWKGDLYGPVHDLPHGTIWLFLLIAALPWSLIGAAVFVRSGRMIRRKWKARRSLAIYALAAAAVPMLLFTAAQNVIFPYALPALVPGVIAALVLLGEETMSKAFIAGTAVIAAATASAFVLSATLLSERVEAESERELVAAVTTELGAPTDSLYYWQRGRLSADYYSRGQAQVLQGTDELERFLMERRQFYLAMEQEQFDALPQDLKRSLQRLGDYSKKAIYGPVLQAATEVPSAAREVHSAVRQ